MACERLDVLVLGAGISGIDAAWHLRHRCPGKTFMVLERSHAIGGTWATFKYPGIRSDSDMFTYAFGWKPWQGTNMIADGHEIRAYLREAVEENDLLRHIRFGQEAAAAEWSSTRAEWRVRTRTGAEFTCSMLLACTGWYSHAGGYTPEFSGIKEFRGRVVHPQAWDNGVKYRGKRVLLIGSGATAITMAPHLAEHAASVTLLQRSPTYIVSIPRQGHLTAHWLWRRIFPRWMLALLSRWLHIFLSWWYFFLCTSFPEMAKPEPIRRAQAELPQMDPREFEKHFTPRYNPWEQRLCVCPDGDFFGAIRAGRLTVVTDRVERFTEGGVELVGGGEIAADLVITATGWRMPCDPNEFLASGMVVRVDGEVVDFGARVMYRGILFDRVPNFGWVMGYLNASWTLKSDLVCEYFCNLVQEMDRGGFVKAVPATDHEAMRTEGILSNVFNSGFVQRSERWMPRQGTRAPWRVNQNYLKDLYLLWWRPVRDGELLLE